MRLASVIVVLVVSAISSTAAAQPGTDLDDLDRRVIELYRAGKYEEAIPLAKRAAVATKEARGECHPDYATSLNNLASLYDSMGDYARAESLYRQALEIDKDALGEDHPHYADSLNNLAGLYQSMGDYAHAEPLFRKALEIRKKALGENHPRYAASLNSLAGLYQAMGDYARAEPLYRQAPEIVRRALGEDHPHYAAGLNNLAFLYQSMGDYARAEPLHRQALEIKKKVLGEEHPSYAQSLENVAALYESMGDYARAEPLYRQALEIRKEVFGDGHPLYAQSLSNLAALYQAMGDYARAEPMCRQALETRRKALGENHSHYAAGLNNLAALYQAMGDYARAEPLHRRAMEIRKKALGEDHPEYAQSLNNLASLYQSMGDYARAESLYRQAREIRKKALGEDHPDFTQSLNNLASLYQSMGDYARAEPMYRQALGIRKKALGEYHPDYATSLNNLAGLYELMGDYARAEPLFRQALEIFKKVFGEYHPRYATILNNLAELYSSMGDYAQAEPLYRQALEIIKKALGEDHPDYAQGLNNLASLYDSMGDYARAEPLYRQALEIRKEVFGTGHPHYATTIDNLAGLYWSMSDYARAEPLYRQALEIIKKKLGEDHPDHATSLNNLALLYKSMNDYTRAEPLYRQALEITKKALGEDHPCYATILNNLAALYSSMGDYARAEPLLGQALDITLANLELASAVQSKRQQVAMTTSVRHFLASYLSLLAKSPASTRDAYERFLRWRGSVTAREQATRELLDDPDARLVWDRLGAATRRLATLSFAMPEQEAFDTWRGQVAELRALRERLEAELSSVSASYRESRRAARTTTEDVRRALGEGTALVDMVEYMHSTSPAQKDDAIQSEPRLGAFVLRHDAGPLWVPLGPTDRIERAVVRWREHRRTAAAADEAGQVLHDIFWTALEPHLAGAATILVAPDGPLTWFPLGALPGKKAGRYLLEERSIAILPIPQRLPVLMARSASASPERSSLLLVGDVDYGAEPGRPAVQAESRAAATGRGARPHWGALPNTGPEIEAVAASFARAYPEGRVTTLRAAEAREQRIRELSGGYKYFHLATHGFFAPELARARLQVRAQVPLDLAVEAVGFSPGLMSGLALAGANREIDPLRDDGVLTALEVGSLDLCAELVVLSACETGIGAEAPSEGVLGLQRAFQVAGARTVVATLWSVDDARTRELMERFYENLWVRRLPRLEALRQAQISMMRGAERADTDSRGIGGLASVDEPAETTVLPPDLWAGFVLSGDWR